MACLIVLADHVAAASPGIGENLGLESQASPSLSNISHQPIFDFLVNPNLVNLRLYLVTYTFDDTITVSLLIGEVTNLFILSLAGVQACRAEAGRARDGLVRQWTRRSGSRPRRPWWCWPRAMWRELAAMAPSPPMNDPSPSLQLL